MGKSYTFGSVTLVVNDFVKSFYPGVSGTRGSKNEAPSVISSRKSSPTTPAKSAIGKASKPLKLPASDPQKNEVSKSEVSFGSGKMYKDFPFLLVNQAALDLIDLQRGNHRAPDTKGFGIFEKIGGDLSLIKPGLESNDLSALEEIRNLCLKIYRSTNMRYKHICKLLMRNQHTELTKMIQMAFSYKMEKHMCLSLTQVYFQHSERTLVIADGPDCKNPVLEMESLKPIGFIDCLDNEQVRCCIAINDLGDN